MRIKWRSVDKLFFAILNRLSWNKEIKNRYHDAFYLNTADALVISYPRCGRNWVKNLIGRAFQLYSGIYEMNFEAPHVFSILNRKLPRVFFTHYMWRYKKCYKKHKNKKIVLLVRDLRDVLVSNYYYFKGHTKDISLHDYLKSWSIDSIIENWNMWYDNRKLFNNFLFVKYENLIADTKKELRIILDFIGAEFIKDEIIELSVIKSTFNEMKSRELLKKIGMDGNALICRIGESGSYKDYINEEEDRYLINHMKKLNPVFGYERYPKLLNKA